jgi:hypothetical protein
MNSDTFTEDELARIEREHASGLTSEQIVSYFVKKGFKFTEATLRKYVQLGLLPRSRRVGLKGKHRGSQGMYPVTVVRRIQHLKTLMEKYTIEQIQREFLFVRGDIEELERTLERIFASLGAASKPPKGAEGAARVATRELSEARAIAAELVAKLASIETRLTMQARLQREAV